MRPRLWWRVTATADAFGPRPLVGLARAGRAMMATGPNLYSVVRWRAHETPDRAAIIDAAGSLTYGELSTASEALARWLVSDGVGTAPRIGVFCRNPRRAVLVILATQRLGIDTVLLNTLASVAEVDRLVIDRNLVVVSDDPAYGTHQLPGDAPGSGDGARGNEDGENEDGKNEDGVTLPRMARFRRSPTVAILTSGSTGTPKMIDKRLPISALDTLAGFIDAIGVRRGDRVSLMLPVFHGHGLATVGLSLALGGTLTLRPPSDQRADGFRADWAAIGDDAIDVIVAVPTVLQRLLDAEPDRDEREATATANDVATGRSTVRAIVSGSAPITPSTIARLTARFGDVLHNVYGSSEAGVISHAGPVDLAADPRTVGRPLVGVDCQIRPVDGAGGTDRHLATGGVASPSAAPSVGEVWVRGGLAGRDWLGTRDLGSIDDRGRLRLHGRADSVLVIGGEKVAPETLEDRIEETAGVVECAVRGIPDQEYGTRVELLVVLEPGATIDGLRDALDESLPRTLRPTSIIEVDRLPRTALGKLQRRSLAAIASPTPVTDENGCGR